MALLLFGTNHVDDVKPTEHSGGWYADPFGAAARRWFDNVSGWSNRVQEPGRAPDRTGVARVDEAARLTTQHGRWARTASPCHCRGRSPQYLASARPIR